MQAVPRPSARKLLCGRLLVPRVSLLALPTGPVVGVDLAHGGAVVVELPPPSAAGDDQLDRPGVREVWTHLGRTVVVSELVVERPATPVARARAPSALRRELGSRRARVALVAAALVAGALGATSLLGGARQPARRTAAPVPVQAPVLAVIPAPPATLHARAVPPVPGARGGAARVLVSAPPPASAPVPTAHVAAPVVERPRVAARSPGWVDGLVVGP